MLSAKLRHRVNIEALTIIQDGYGGPNEIWTAIATGIPAEIVPLSGREYIASGSLQAAIDTRITLRFVPGILPAMRIVNGDLKYNIKTILPDPTLRRHLTLMCESFIEDANWAVFPPTWNGFENMVVQRDTIDLTANREWPDD